MARIGADPRLLVTCRARASENGTALMDELVASGQVDERTLCRALAATCGLAYVERLDPRCLQMDGHHRLAALGSHHGWPLVGIREAGYRMRFLITPVDPDPRALTAFLLHYPSIAGRVALVAPTDLRRAILARSETDLMREARIGLFERYPRYSARFVATAWQGLLLGVLIATLPLLFLFHGTVAGIVLHAATSLFFLCCVVLRLLALSKARPPGRAVLAPVRPASLPVYSVLVALHREAEMVPQLLLALGKLQWPRSKLEIKLVCEADDSETLTALRAFRLHPSVEVVAVPPGEPRTKPKALAYALPLCGGEFVALYDAEDRPHPLQLIEAWQCFRAADERLACVQAPLFVSNARSGMLARMFAFEYSALFRGMLPWLASGRLIFPLGGTSNHFRRSALDEVGGWDPFNVTEDADLGLRLFRFGYRSQTITHPTFEDAPEDVATWLPQRTRWFKGWLQTWLVHMRDPGALARELGTASFAVSQVLFLGLLMSALIHPVYLATLAVIGGRMLLAGPVDTYESVLFAIDSINIALGYGAFLALGARTMARGERRHFWKIVLCTPLYWILMSAAAWRSLAELYFHPHRWNKTTHRRTKRAPRENDVSRPRSPDRR